MVPVDWATIQSPHKSLLSFALLSLHISSVERQLSFFLGAFAWLRSSLRPESASKLPIRLVRALARATFAARTNTRLPSPPKAFPVSPHIYFSHAYYLGGFVVTVSCHWLYGPTPAFAPRHFPTRSCVSRPSPRRCILSNIPGPGSSRLDLAFA